MEIDRLHSLFVTVPGIDYEYRPLSCFENLTPQQVILGSILGEARRKDVAERMTRGDFDPTVFGDWLTESQLDDTTREMLGKVHTAFMGGEYLPPLRGNELRLHGYRSHR